VIDPQLAICDAVIRVLRANAAMRLLQDQRAYDDAPSGAAFPYSTLGPVDVRDSGDQAHDGAEVMVQVDFWSRATGKAEARAIVTAAVAALDTDIAPAGHEIIVHRVERTAVMKDPDGQTTHGLVQVAYITAPKP
jgi:hypothetical protein